jgi:putative flippase GtrA
MVSTASWSQTWFRFGLVGLLNAGFGYMVFALLVLSGVRPTIALVATMIVAVGFNFQTSRKLVFGSPGHSLRFVAVYVVILIINSAALEILRWCGLTDLASQAFLTLPIAALSFVCQRRYVFNLIAGENGRCASETQPFGDHGRGLQAAPVQAGHFDSKPA